MSTKTINRRDFLKLSGFGLWVLFQIDPRQMLEAFPQFPAGSAYPTDFNAYLRILPDGSVNCFVGKVEMGQGVMTALAQLLADELDVPFDSVHMVMGDTDLCPWDMGTFGSLSIWQFGPYLRKAGAEARAVLLQMAAERLQAPGNRLQVRDGVISDTSTPEKRVTFAQLVDGKRIERHIENVPVKDASGFRVIGQSPQRKDALDKVTGRAKYSGDLAIPGTLHARILRPPMHGARLKSVDTAAAEKMDGIRVIKDGDMIAVLHERPDMADRALKLITADFESPEATVDDKTIFDHILKILPEGSVVGESGNIGEGEKLAVKIVEGTYLNSYVAHAAMETHSAVASMEGDKLTIWAGTQTPFRLKQQVAQALSLAPQNVRVITPYIGGGFGGKSSSQQAIEAARLTRLAGRPVQVVWDRPEEFFNDTFRPAAVVKIRAGLSKTGDIAFWNYQVYGAGDRESKTFYDIPNQRTTSAGGWQGGNPVGLHPFDVGAWRAPSVNTNTFARESLIDTLAAAAGMDPVEFRLRHLSDKRMRSVLEAVAKQFGRTPGPAPSGQGIGVACGIYSGTYVATMAKVTVDKSSGGVKVDRVVCAMDLGTIVNPEGVRQQVEGAVTMGLGYTLSEEVRFNGGRILDSNFITYKIPRFSWLPKIETILIDTPDLPPQSCGEPPIITTGAVIANAIFDSAGIRLMQLPMTPVRVQRARQ